jgi:type IX secretion system PorP/SprF family membrane protein
MKKKIFVFWCCFLMLFFAQAQEDYFVAHSRFMQKENVSFFGFNNLNRVGVLYNTLQLNGTQNMDNKYFFGNLSFEEKKFSLGIDINSYQLESSGLVSTQANFAYVYQVQITNDLYFLPAVSFGIGNKNLIVANLVLEDQLDKASGFINSESRDPLSSQVGTVNYTDLGASFLLHNDEYIIGMALKHLNRPNISFNKEQNQQMPMTIVVNGGYEFNVNPYERNFLPRYSFLFTYGSLTKYDTSYYLYLSQELQLGEFSLGISQQASKVQSINLNNFGLSVGLSLENFDIGILYNIGIKNVKQVFAPSIFELYLTFDFSKFRRNNRGLYKRLQIDNYF